MSMKEHAGQIRIAAANGHSRQQLSTVGGHEHLSSPDAARAVVQIESRPPALVGIRIPSRNETVRQLVIRVFLDNVHLQRNDLFAVVRYGTLAHKFRKLSDYLDGLPNAGVVKADGEPRKALAELRSLSMELSRLETSLGITAGARAALGIDITRLHRMADGGGGGAPDDDLIALEQRIIVRLNGGQDAG